ncbi:hypothetical protein GCM10011506_22040 [Marivirga lumbricoides]|uniref:Antitoxin SocA-like Panacea domain-containing protein n=1 Tax=Marivirga lumbricoides TaxID=1046115 RepID=A0ABQ1M7V5_9BACT|nr:hypothetical protein GCM10011506_22040 [Marivirga lumbricoides]
MKSPITGKEMPLRQEKGAFDFRKEQFEIVYHYYECEESKERFESEELTQLNLSQVYNQYRKRHNLPFPEEIKELRETYNLSAAKMSEVLGFGINVYRSYEQGEIPNSSNAKLIQLTQDPREFKKLVSLSSSLSEKEKTKINQRINELLLEEVEFESFDVKDYLMGQHSPDETTGYRLSNLEKFTEMVVFFTYEAQPWKTKMNKLLFYADFLHFKRCGVSISGTQYRAIDMGPVPNNYQSLFEYIANKDDVDVYHTQFENGGVGEQFKPHHERVFDPELFDEKELETLQIVAKKFKKAKTQEIVNISHQEKAWKDNFSNGKNLINYLYAFELITI